MTSNQLSVAPSPTSVNRLDILAHGAAYAQPGVYPIPDSADLRHPPGPAAPLTSASLPVDARPQPSRKRASHSASNGSNDDDRTLDPPRKRITRACDRCNAQRTRCDGADPCSTCIDSDVLCKYERVAKKRGKLSARDRRAQADADSAVARKPDHNLPLHEKHDGDSRAVQTESEQPAFGHQTALTDSAANEDTTNKSRTARVTPSHQAPPIGESYGFDDCGGGDGFMSQAPEYAQFADPAQAQSASRLPTPLRRAQQPPGDQTVPNQPVTAAPADASMLAWLGGLNTGNSPVGALNAARSPSGMSLPAFPSPNNVAFFQQPSGVASRPIELKHPVLCPLIPRLMHIMPLTLANELLELYFASSNVAFQHPISPYVVASIFRKNSFLEQDNPRQTAPALLASILWISAQTSDARYLTQSVASRGRVCQKLLELTLELLKPLIHQSSNTEDPSVTVINGVALGGFGVSANLPLPGGRHAADVGQFHPSSTGGEIDDIVTYMHLATVISASEYKAASMRWWSVVYSLVWEFGFNKELPRFHDEAVSDATLNSTPMSVSEETREERRRVWWLVYTVDKHLALCYNRPLSLRDFECIDLLRPVPEAHWQAGETYTGPPAPDTMRPRGIYMEMTDNSIFGFFTPLMALLSEAIDLQQARLRTTSGYMTWPLDATARQIRQHVDGFLESVQAYRENNLPPDIHNGIHGASMSNGTLSEQEVQTVVATAYAAYIARVVKVLVSGKWDPIQLLDDADLWISSEDFVLATGTAIDGAEYLAPILELDPELSYMPWFFGIYLLQGSFLLLLYADRLGAAAGDRYSKACERAARAVEACVVTLNTEYQRNFRKVMRSALFQVRGRQRLDIPAAEANRREVLSLYRWTPDGHGLAL